MSQRIRTLVVAVALGAALAVALPAPAEAAGFRGGSRLPVLDAWERAWGWLARLATPGETARREKEGSAINPDGSPAAGSAAPDPGTTETGGGLDPLGTP